MPVILRLERLDDRLESRLGLVLTVEEERMICAAFDGVIVKPGATVVGAPEADHRHRGMTHQGGDDFAVAFRQLLLLRWRETVGIGVGAFLYLDHVRAAYVARQGINIQLRDEDLHARGRQGGDGRFDHVRRRPMDQPVTLKADGVEADAGALEGLHELDRLGELVRLLEVVIVVS